MIFEICTDDLKDQLKEVVTIRMEPESGRIVSMEGGFQSLHKPDVACKFLNQKQAGIRGEGSSLEIDYKFPVAFKSDGR